MERGMARCMSHCIRNEAIDMHRGFCLFPRRCNNREEW